MHDMFPYWYALFAHLDLGVVLSGPTSPKTVRDTGDHAVPESCFPVQLVYGHTVELLDRDVDFMLLASVMDREISQPGQQNNKYCPFIPAAGQMVRAHLEMDARGVRALTFPLHLSEPRALKRQIGRLARQLGISERKALSAADRGAKAQQEFYEATRAAGERALAETDLPIVVLVGRPYNTCDMGVCHDLPRQLRKLGVLPLPIDFLPVRWTDITERHHDMYWRSGQDILAAGQIIRDDDRLHAIYLTSFDCGPDSFILSYFKRMMGSKPFLELEVDDHTAAAGMLTRCEAFLDSINLTPA
jgi:predicted nucleotide-binding protein (sugar kinase/HSP70/actin superfamily)